MTRRENWQSDLTALINSRREEPYSIIGFNCLLWACEAVQAVIGEDYYAPFRGLFKTEQGAAKILRRRGRVIQCSDWLERNLGERKHIAFIKKGDIVVADGDQPELGAISDVALFGPPVGVCYGLHSYFVGELGLVAIDTLSLGQGGYGFSC